MKRSHRGRAAARYAKSLVCCALSIAATAEVAAQAAFPAKTIRILVGAPPGGSNDIFARAVGQRLNEAWGQPVVVENRPGANQMIAAELMAKSAPDGHTLYVTSTSYTTGAAINPKLPFDPVNDVSGVTLLGKGPMVLVVHPALPVKSVKDLVALARAKPGELNYTSAGTGSINHLGVEVLQAAAKIRMTHVPHKGMAPAITDLVGGHVQVLLVSLPSVQAQMNTGRLRALGVSSPKRSSFVPELPAIAESVPGYDNELWWGIFAPARTPAPVLEKLNQEIHKALATEEMKKRFASFGAEAAPTTPEGLSGIVRSEIAKWTKVVRDAQIRPE
jgi:tripartite-type tricarboxylate transporter receptor subunit TctC